MSREPSLARLEYLDRHPVRAFFADEQLTSARINVGITGLVLVTVVGVITGAAHPVGLLFALAGRWILWRNHRRFQQRVHVALAERHAPQTP